ncbi:hypothetical protein M419DRAFT_39261 [Trichoderma reesei RUT C-30]|nr:hypothetical protein M419DRAFT_39261 [Trichoderma reesei RUT C-30]
MLVERNLDTTKWPKMDLTNCRSMELFRRLRISEGLREIGVPPEYSFDVIFSTGLAEGGEEIARWKLDSVNAWRKRIKSQNNGTLPREPYQRCSQAVLKAWLKPRIQAQKLINAHFGLKCKSLTETDNGVESTLTDVRTGEQHVVQSKYVMGCDGAGSHVRRSLGINLLGGPVAFLIAQDEVNTWTLHTPIPIDADWEKIDPQETVYNALGGPSGPWPIKIDEILVKSTWRPNICIAERYISPSGRVFLAGDSAHQNIPTGGYGMNTAVGDSFDLGWKLAAVLNGYGGELLLKSYELERLPVAVRNINHSGTLWQRWARIWSSCAQVRPDILSQSKLGKAFKAELAHSFLTNDGENQDHGIEMGYRYNASPVVVGDSDASEPEWNFRHYVPSTWPGARPPHVFLADGETSIFDLFGQEYTIVDFSKDGKWAYEFGKAAERLCVPLEKVHLPTEKHVRDLWERDAVLIRPDDHVAWRSPRDHTKFEGDVGDILEIAVGLKGNLEAGVQIRERALDEVRQKGFAGTVGNVNQDNVAMKAGFQK